MSSANPFGLLEDDEVGDVNHLVEVQRKKLEAAAAESAAAEAAAAAAAKKSQAASLTAKPPPPNQAVKEGRSEYGRGGGRGGDRGGRGGRGFNRESNNNENLYENNNGYPGGGYRQSEVGDSGRAPTERRGGYGSGGGGRGPYRGGAGGGGARRSGFSNGEVEEGGERPRRAYERRSGTGRGSEIKREGSGRGNWGTTADDITPEVEEPVVEADKAVDAEKPAEAVEATKEEPVAEPEKEKEDKEMTLEEYQKVLEEKRKVLESLKTSEERKVDSKEFESMKQISCKKENNEIFAQLGSEKDKRKEAAQKEEKAKKSVSINEFLKPAGDKNYSAGGRGRGRGRGARGGGFGGGFGGGNASSHGVAAPSIEDPGQFPTLGGK